MLPLVDQSFYLLLFYHYTIQLNISQVLLFLIEWILGIELRRWINMSHMTRISDLDSIFQSDVFLYFHWNRFFNLWNKLNCGGSCSWSRGWVQDSGLEIATCFTTFGLRAFIVTAGTVPVLPVDFFTIALLLE